MVSKTFGLLFYLKKGKSVSELKRLIYMRVTVSSERTEISTKRYCHDIEKWNASLGSMTGNKESTKILNAYLDSLQTKVYDALRFLVDRDELVTAEKIKNKLTGNRERPKKILEVFHMHNDQIKELVGNTYAPLTLKRYTTALEHAKKFILWKYKLSDLEITRLNYEFISEYEFYLKSVRKCGHNSTMKYLSNLKKVVLLCLKKGWLQKDPFYGFHLATKEVIREILSQDELAAIAAKKFSTDRLNITRDIFLFCHVGVLSARSTVGKQPGETRSTLHLIQWYPRS
ncbi:MAG TPA: phage integrase SAM-like domain and Arm DNA-binding domain-containing protein [Puia sp.]